MSEILIAPKGIPGKRFVRDIFLLSLLFCLLTNTDILGQAAKQYPTVASRKAFYEKLSTEYCSKGVQEILHSDTKNEFEAYVEGHSEQELMASYETVVHELLHGYNNQGHSAKFHAYFLPSWKVLEVQMTEVFSSRELNDFVRAGQQDSIFRYAIYVGGKRAIAQHGNRRIMLNDGGSNDISSVAEGLYGLIEEFNAYYFGTLATWELFDYYKDTYGMVVQDIWSDYKHLLLGNTVAYYEFRLFIAWYLMYAQEEHPSIYAGLLSNHDLRRAFTALDAAYADLLAQIEGAIPQLDRLSGPDVMEIFLSTGTDKEIRAFLAENGIDAEAMGLSPGTPEWEAIRAEYLNAMEEMKASMPSDLAFFHGQAKAQMLYLKSQLKQKEADVLKGFVD